MQQNNLYANNIRIGWFPLWGHLHMLVFLPAMILFSSHSECLLFLKVAAEMSPSWEAPRKVKQTFPHVTLLFLGAQPLLIFLMFVLTCTLFASCASLSRYQCGFSDGSGTLSHTLSPAPSTAWTHNMHSFPINGSEDRRMMKSVSLRSHISKCLESYGKYVMYNNNLWANKYINFSHKFWPQNLCLKKSEGLFGRREEKLCQMSCLEK